MVQKLHERIAASEVVCESAAVFIERIFDSLTDEEAHEAAHILKALRHFSSSGTSAELGDMGGCEAFSLAGSTYGPVVHDGVIDDITRLVPGVYGQVSDD